jgi:titin
VDLTWADTTSETGYDIQRCTGVGCTNFARIDGVGVNIAAYTDPTVVASTTYSYRVVAFNMTGNSAPSNIATVTTPAPPVVGPTAPTNLTATLLSGPTRAQLSWTDASNNENLFRIFRSTNGGTFALVGTVNRSGTQRTATGGTVTFTNNNLVAGNTYAYYVIAVNTVPNPDQLSVPSNTASVTLPTLPAAPTNLRVTAAARTSISLAWNDNSNNETTFEIQYRLGGQTFQTLVIVPANTTVYINTGWPPNYTIFYRVRAVNAGGNSAWSNTVQGSTLP